MLLAEPCNLHYRAFLLPLLLAGGPASAQQSSTPPVPKVPSAETADKRLTLHLVARSDWAQQSMEIVKGLILFQGRLNNRPATILLDNGTGRTVVDTGFARQG
ncbi:hypothetical protein SAQ01S_17090 [Sphingomonas aquatilis NBRC 16722]|nr:hypothetical protein SAQ01S_17090 [Sphingomonas aquatilis NBRC 16722]